MSHKFKGEQQTHWEWEQQEEILKEMLTDKNS